MPLNNVHLQNHKIQYNIIQYLLSYIFVKLNVLQLYNCNVFTAFIESVGVVLKKYQMLKEIRLVKKCRDVFFYVWFAVLIFQMTG